MNIKKLFLILAVSTAIVGLFAACLPCFDKPLMVRCVDGWGDPWYRDNVNSCTQENGVTFTENGSVVGDCGCYRVPKERLCE